MQNVITQYVSTPSGACFAVCFVRNSQVYTQAEKQESSLSMGERERSRVERTGPGTEKASQSETWSLSRRKTSEQRRVMGSNPIPCPNSSRPGTRQSSSNCSNSDTDLYVCRGAAADQNLRTQSLPVADQVMRQNVSLDDAGSNPVGQPNYSLQSNRPAVSPGETGQAGHDEFSSEYEEMTRALHRAL